jgi:hypothetical protein
MVREAIAAYAADVAGTREDLDRDLESASLELWRDEPKPRKRGAIKSAAPRRRKHQR